jgi:hypothetical protein
MDPVERGLASVWRRLAATASGVFSAVVAVLAFLAFVAVLAFGWFTIVWILDQTVGLSEPERGEHCFRELPTMTKVCYWVDP